MLKGKMSRNVLYPFAIACALSSPSNAADLVTASCHFALCRMPSLASVRISKSHKRRGTASIEDSTGKVAAITELKTVSKLNDLKSVLMSFCPCSAT